MLKPGQGAAGSKTHGFAETHSSRLQNSGGAMNFCRDERVNEAARGVFWVGYSATNHLTHQDANMPLRETLGAL